MPFSVTVPDLKNWAMVEAGGLQNAAGSEGTWTAGLQEVNVHASSAIPSKPAPVLMRRGYFMQRLFWSLPNLSLFSRPRQREIHPFFMAVIGSYSNTIL